MTAERSDGDARGPRPIRIGISACLPGQPVRFDGGHRRDAFLTETFGRFVEWLPYLAAQAYLQPHPKELMLRNRV